MKDKFTKCFFLKNMVILCICCFSLAGCSKQVDTNPSAESNEPDTGEIATYSNEAKRQLVDNDIGKISNESVSSSGATETTTDKDKEIHSYSLSDFLKQSSFTLKDSLSTSILDFDIYAFAKSEGFETMWDDYKQMLTISKDSTCIEISIPEQKVFINGVLYPCSSSVEGDGVLWVNESDFISALFKYGIKFNCREIWWEDRSTIEFEAFYREKGYFPTRLIEYNNSDDSFSVNTNRHLSKKTLERWSTGVTNLENYGERIFYRINIEGISGYIFLEKDDSDNYIASKWAELEITDPCYYTDRFIHVGDSMELVAKIYGSPDNYSDDEWQASIVPAEGGGIKFIFDKLLNIPYL